MSRILLAVSGGMDSMYMLARSFDLFPGSEVAVAHCNFGLRGPESDGDEEFVRGWCVSHGIACFTKRFPTSEYAAEKHISIEMAARDLRYAWFAQLLSSEGFDAVAVAHNADDNAETLLLNLLRGTGSRGLRGMGQRALPGGGVVLRPLLDISRAEIADWMKEHGVPHREDSTNALNVYKRNKIRLSVFPVFAEINPSFLKTLGADMRHFAQVDDIAEEWFRENAPAVFDGSTISVPALMALKHWEYMLWRILEPFGLDEPTLEDLKATLLAGGTVSGKTFGAPQWKAVTGSGRIMLLKRDPGSEPGMRVSEPGMREAEPGMKGSKPGMRVDGPGEYSFGGLRFAVKVFDRPAGFELRQPGGRLVFDAAALPFPLKLRHWQDGDWMKPLGLGGRKKLSDLFVDLKLSLPEKEKAVVLEHPDGTEGHVGALLCTRLDESLKVRPSTQTILEIEFLS